MHGHKRFWQGHSLPLKKKVGRNCSLSKVSNRFNLVSLNMNILFFLLCVIFQSSLIPRPSWEILSLTDGGVSHVALILKRCYHTHLWNYLLKLFQHVPLNQDITSPWSGKCLKVSRLETGCDMWSLRTMICKQVYSNMFIFNSWYNLMFFA